MTRRLREQRKKDAEQLQMKLRTAFGARPVPGYIAHIRFPLFKNIEPGSSVEFTFPITALVGSNGSGKTSVLHAMYGAPYGKSTSDFWFATDVDPIREGKGAPNRFIYGHVLDGVGLVETRKARVSSPKSRKPGYFEPTKATRGDGMDLTPFPASSPVVGQSKDRWNPVQRPLLYINFRSELSAFDKFMYFGWSPATKTMQNKQERAQRDARRLGKAMSSKTWAIP